MPEFQSAQKKRKRKLAKLKIKLKTEISCFQFFIVSLQLEKFEIEFKMSALEPTLEWPRFCYSSKLQFKILICFKFCLHFHLTLLLLNEIVTPFL